MPALLTAAKQRSPPLFLLRTTHLPVESCGRISRPVSELFAEQRDARTGGAAARYNWPEILELNHVFSNVLADVDASARAAGSCDAVAGVVDVAQLITTRPDYFEKKECMHMLESPSEGAKGHGWSLQVLWNTFVDLRPLSRRRLATA